MIINKDYEIKDSVICNCGHKFTLRDVNGLEPLDQHGFFANIVKNCSVTNCPECGLETILLLKQRGQTWDILGIAAAKDGISQATIQNKTEKEKNEEFICPECQKVCKNKVGLIGHMRTHYK